MSGVLYFNVGHSCLVRLLVSLLSLRWYYSGPVSIAAADLPVWSKQIASELSASITKIQESQEYVLVQKSKLWRVSPFDETLFLDADTLILKPIDEIFSFISNSGLAVTKHNGWSTDTGRIRGRIERWRVACPDLVESAIKYGMAINTGVVGWTRNNPAMEQCENLCGLGMRYPVMRKVLDEIAMQLTIPHHNHALLGQEWNCCPVHGETSSAKIVHFYGNRHCRSGVAACAQWLETFSELRSSFSGIQTETDPHLTKFLLNR